MTTVEQIRTEIESFKSLVATGVDRFASAGHITRDQADSFLSRVGIERPESPEVRQAREDLAALKARVRNEIEAQESDSYRRQEALRSFGL